MDDSVDTNDIVATARRRFQLAKDFYGIARQQAVADTRFAMGDSDNRWQWPDDIVTSRISQKKVMLTVNITAQHCNQIINNIRQNRPASKVSPADDYADKRTAELIEGLLRNIKASSHADDAHDVASEHAIYGGEGYWRVRTEYESDTSFDQVIVIDPLPNPNLVFVDCFARKSDRSDAEWGFIFEDISKEEFKRKHPDIDAASWTNDPGGWVQENTVRQAEYYYCEYVKDTVCLLSTGQTVLKSELKKYPFADIVKERPTERVEWHWCLLVGGNEDPIEKEVWPGKYLPIITVVGKELNVDGEIVRKGIVRDLKDSARMVNYAYSETVQSLALQNKIPYLAEAESIKGHEAIWQQANLENFAFLPYNAYDENDKPLPKPERQQGSPMATAQVQLLQLSTEQMRASSGQQNANFGIRSEAQSGVGIQRLKVQGETATFHFPDNLAKALRYEDVVLIDLIQKIYDTPRVVRVLGLDGKMDKVMLDPGMDRPHAEVEGNSEDEQAIQRIFNPQLGRYDVVIDTGPTYQTQRQEAADRLTEMTTRNPQLMQVAGDIIVRAQDFPMSEELARRLEKTIPPALLQDDKKLQIPPEVQAQMDAAQQHLEGAGQMIQQLQAELKEAQEKTQLEQQMFSAKLQADTSVKMAAIQSQEKISQDRIKADLVKAKWSVESTGLKTTQDNATRKDIAELQAVESLLSKGIAPPQDLAADVSEDLQEEDNTEQLS